MIQVEPLPGPPLQGPLTGLSTQIAFRLTRARARLTARRANFIIIHNQNARRGRTFWWNHCQDTQNRNVKVSMACR